MWLQDHRCIDFLAMVDALSSIGALRDSVDVIVRQGKPFDQLRAELRELPSRSAVFIAYFRRDGHGQIFVPLEAFAILAHESRAPIYSYSDALLDRGFVGGAMFSNVGEATSLGRLAARVVRRPPGAPLPPFEISETPFIANWRKLRDFNLDERRLPPGTEIRFRPPTLWERDRREILITLAIIGAQALLIAALLVERRARRRAQDALYEQSAYERTMAEVATDAVRHAPEDAPRALEDALGRVGLYADADTAVLIQYEDSSSRPERRVEWARRPSTSIESPLLRDSEDPQFFRLSIPLVVGGAKIGALELKRFGCGKEWSTELATRLVAAAEVIAGAIARSNDAAAYEAWRQLRISTVATVGEHQPLRRPPLTAIRVNAETGMRLLQTSSPDIDEAKEVMGDIVADAARASATIEQIRLMLRMQGPAATALDINDIAAQATSLLQRDATARGVRLGLELAPNLPRVRGNRVELQQAIFNLALNGVDAASTVCGTRAVTVGAAAISGSVELFVHDTGPGLSADVRPHLFVPFFTTKENGLGMGLSIVRTLVEQHGGESIVMENHGGGAIFRLVFPAAMPSPSVAAEGSVTPLSRELEFRLETRLSRRSRKHRASFCCAPIAALEFSDSARRFSPRTCLGARSKRDGEA